MIRSAEMYGKLVHNLCTETEHHADWLETCLREAVKINGDDASLHMHIKITGIIIGNFERDRLKAVPETRFVGMSRIGRKKKLTRNQFIKN